MPTYYARASGNVNAAIWATTPTGTAADFFSSFTNADVLVANNFTVTLNVSVTVAQVRNDATGGATAGGGFTITGAVTLTANVTGQQAAISSSVASPLAATIIGNVAPLTTVSANTGCVVHSGAGTLNVIGNVSAGIAGNSFHGCQNNSTGTLNITGSASGNTSSGVGAVNSSAGVVSITGNVAGSTAAAGASNSAGGSLFVTGDVTGGAGGSSSTSGVVNAGSGAVVITGTVRGGGSSLGYGAVNSGVGSLTVVGQVVASAAAPGAVNIVNGTMSVTRAVGNAFGPGSTGSTSQVGAASLAAGSVTYVKEIEYGDRGQSPTSGAVIFDDVAGNVAIFYRPPALTKKTLIDAASTAGLFPAASDVRSGTSYNANSLTGTCEMPSPASVTFGVPVGGTTGTAVLTPDAVWAHLTGSMTTSGSIGERMANAATPTSVGQILVGAA